MKNLAGFSIVLLVLSSCGGGGDSGGVGGAEGYGRQVSDVIRNSDQGATFVAKCQEFVFQGKTAYAESRFTFLPTRARESGIAPFSEQIEIFDDKDCKNSDHLATAIAKGDYGFNGNGSKALITYQNYLFIPQKDSYARSLNESNYCGLAAWETGVGREFSKEGSCWEVWQKAAYLLSSLDEGRGDKILIHNCSNEALTVPSAECMKLEARRVK